jgi:integrase/recombinase XerD
METVTLKPLQHRGVECIGIYSPANATLNHYYQKKAGAKWSRTCKCWYIPCSEKNYEQLAKVLMGKVVLELKELKSYLLEKQKNGNTVRFRLLEDSFKVSKSLTE